MDDTQALFDKWGLDDKAIRWQMYRAPTPRERERWHAVWLRARGWPVAQIAGALGRDAHTIGEWLRSFQENGPPGLAFEQTGGPPPFLPGKNKRS